MKLKDKKDPVINPDFVTDKSLIMILPFLKIISMEFSSVLHTGSPENRIIYPALIPIWDRQMAHSFINLMLVEDRKGRDRAFDGYSIGT
ncbi:MAG: hypothetical protein ACRCT1_05395 [Microcoleaceae cyanobacterium]